MFQASSRTIDVKPEVSRAELACLSFVVHPALALLWQARDLSAEAFGTPDVESAWAFAPQVADLVTLGMSEPQLRLLLVKGFVACRTGPECEVRKTDGLERLPITLCSPLAEEVPGVRGKAPERSPIARAVNIPKSLDRTSLLMLTVSGASALTAMLEPWHNGHTNNIQQTFSRPPVANLENNHPHSVTSHVSSTSTGIVSAPHLPTAPSLILPTVDSHAKPHYDKDRRELWYQGHMIKRYKTPAKNQELILLAFEEEGWPVRIDDPLPPAEGIESKLRLRDTISALNRQQSESELRFLGDGSGCGLRWKGSAIVH